MQFKIGHHYRYFNEKFKVIDLYTDKYGYSVISVAWLNSKEYSPYYSYQLNQLYENSMLDIESTMDAELEKL